NVGSHAFDFAWGQLPGARHLRLDSFGNDFAERCIVRRFIELGTMQIRSAASASGLPVAERALRLEEPLAQHRIVDWIRRLREGARDDECCKGPTQFLLS